VNFYEAFVPLTMFAKGEFDKKIKGVFGAFDQDGNQYIDKKELVVFLNTGIFGLCKLVKVPLPRRDDINNYSYVVFKIIDLNKND
jgi:Ca2+-binding EF-hand superfamily protein